MPRTVRRLLGLFLASASLAGAQTIRPAVQEYPLQARGKFDLVNETLFPMTVVLEPRGFRVDEAGNLSDTPFDSANVELKLSAMSFRIPPLATYTVHYEARAKQLPAWFMVLSAMTGARTQSGLNVRLELPHVIYLLQKEPLRREAVTVHAFSWDSVARRVTLDLENTSASLGRVLGSELSTDGKQKTPFGGFPLFPNARRRVEVPWDGTVEPDRMMLRFANFSVEERRAPAAAPPERQ
jgi:hypothetical protein